MDPRDPYHFKVDWLPTPCCCGHQWPSLHHALFECEWARQSYSRIFAGAHRPELCNKSGAMGFLFGYEQNDSIRQLAVRFVGEVVWKSMLQSMLQPISDDDVLTTIDEFIEQAQQAVGFQ